MLERHFLLSPARCDGKRADLLMGPGARHELGRRLHAGEGIDIGDAFAFMSSLYFRGKLAYARHFARVSAAELGVHVITPTRGLVSPDHAIDLEALREFRTIDIASGDARFRGPLEADARRLVEKIGARAEVVLLGSIATGKYLDVLRGLFGARLHFPKDFVGRGDMSRGALLLRAVREGVELDYTPLEGATLTGRRAPSAASETFRAKRARARGP